ncbi:MAG: GNAT family N-acetyltransferase [Pseudomonadota bacterium]
MALTPLPVLASGSLQMRRFTLNDSHEFSRLHADPDVMDDLGGPIDPREAEAKLKTYIDAWARFGYGRFAVFERDCFAGYVGVMHHPKQDHPLGPHDEIGWRLHRAFWGKGVAFRAAQLALHDAFYRIGLSSVLSYTAPDNHRSQAVMYRLGLSRRSDMDFSEHYPPVGLWEGHVWSITAEAWSTSQRSGGME